MLGSSSHLTALSIIEVTSGTEYRVHTGCYAGAGAKIALLSSATLAGRLYRPCIRNLKLRHS